MHPRKRHALALLPALAALGGAAGVRAEPPAIRDKEAQAQQVLAQINDLNRQMGHSVEAYDRATWQLGQTKKSLKANTRRLGEARRALARAQRTLAARAVAIYESGDTSPTLDVLLGARSLGELLDVYDATRRIAAADVKVVLTVRRTREQVAREHAALQRSRARAARLVAEARAQRDAIQQRLAERSRLLGSVRGEIAHLKAEEAARQAELRRQALARLEAQRQAEALAQKRAREAAVRAEAARRAAAARAQKQRAAATTTTTTPAPAPQTTAAPAPPPPPTTTQAATTAPPPPAPPPPASTDLGVAAETPEGASVAPPPTHGDVVGIALRYLGVPYQWGGATPSGFDCSGFVMYVFAQVGVSLPHYSGAQFGYGVAVPRDQLAPGDLVFFDGLTHVGIYIGAGQFVHAPHTGDVVKISSLSEDWYSQTYDGARRL